MRFDPKLTVPEGYEVSFKQANAIFSHARVYDGSSEKLSFLKPLLPSEIRVFNGDLDFLGPDLPPYHALSIAQGRLNPISMSAFDEFVDIKIPSTLNIQSHITTTSMQEDEVKEELIISYIADTDVSSSVSDSGGAILHTVTDEIEEKKPILNSIASAKLNSSSSPSSANDASASIQTNKGFLTHLKHLASSHISSKEWSPKLDDIDEERASSRSTTVSLSPPGNKRVSPLPPNNNPFRKQRAADDSLTFVSKRHIVSRDDEGEAEERVIRLQFNSDAFKKVEMSSLGAPLASSHSGSKRLFGRKEEVLPCGMKMLSHGCFVSEIGGDQVSIPPQDSYDMEVVQNGSMEEELELMCSSSSLNECVEELNPSCSSLSLNQKKQKQSNHESSCAVRYPKKFLESKKMKSNGKQGRQQTKKSSSMPTGIILTYFQRSNRTNLTNPI